MTRNDQHRLIQHKMFVAYLSAYYCTVHRDGTQLKFFQLLNASFMLKTKFDKKTEYIYRTKYAKDKNSYGR